MKFSTMIPMAYNDGRPVHSIEFEALVRSFWSKFGGCTVDAISEGYWVSPDRRLCKEPVRRVTVYAESNSAANLDYARMLVRKVGVRMEQTTMYFEHDASGHTSIEMIDVNPEEDFHSLEKSPSQLHEVIVEETPGVWTALPEKHATRFLALAVAVLEGKSRQLPARVRRVLN